MLDKHWIFDVATAATSAAAGAYLIVFSLLP